MRNHPYDVVRKLEYGRDRQAGGSVEYNESDHTAVKPLKNASREVGANQHRHDVEYDPPCVEYTVLQVQRVQRAVALQQQLIGHSREGGGCARHEGQQYAHQLQTVRKRARVSGATAVLTYLLTATATREGVHLRQLGDRRTGGQQHDGVLLHRVEHLLEDEPHQDRREDGLGGRQYLEDAGLEVLHDEIDQCIVQCIDNRGDCKLERVAPPEQCVCVLVGGHEGDVCREREEQLEQLGRGGGYQNVIVVGVLVVLCGRSYKGLHTHEHGHGGDEERDGRPPGACPLHGAGRAWAVHRYGDCWLYLASLFVISLARFLCGWLSFAQV